MPCLGWTVNHGDQGEDADTNDENREGRHSATPMWEKPADCRNDPRPSRSRQLLNAGQRSASGLEGSGRSMTRATPWWSTVLQAASPLRIILRLRS